MVDTVHKNQKKGAINEEDVCNLLQRYSAGTLLALLKEMSQFVDVKIDWQALMAKTETGIKSASEYQMLWRHLAYRQPLIDNIGAEQQPLDDDSDLEYEVEACPTVSTVDAMEASNCVKVLTSGSTNKSRMSNSSSFEVPRISSENVQVRKLSQAAGTFSEGLKTNGLTRNNQKKRKPPCSEEEDIKLIATVKKGEVKGEGNTTHRAQRANTNRKKQGGLNIGGANIARSKLSELLATSESLKIAFSPGSGFATDLDLLQAAKAAGGRVASPSEASRFKAVQSKNVHIICSGLATTPTSVPAGTASFLAGGQQAKGSVVGPSVLPMSQLSKGKATSVVKT